MLMNKMHTELRGSISFHYCIILNTYFHIIGLISRTVVLNMDFFTLHTIQ